MQERGHLSPGDRCIGTERRGAAAGGDPGGGECVDVRFEDAVIVVLEPIDCGRRQGQSPHQEGGHLPAGDRSAWAEARVVRRVAALRDACGGKPFDVSFEDAAVVVRERPVPHRRVAAADALGTERQRIEVDLHGLLRLRTAVVDVEPEALDVEVVLRCAPPPEVGAGEGLDTVHPAHEHPVVDAGGVERHVALDAVPLAVVERRHVLRPGQDVTTIGWSVEVVGVEADHRLVVWPVLVVACLVAVVAAEQHAGAPARRLGRRHPVAQAVVGVEIRRPGELPAVGRSDEEALRELEVVPPVQRLRFVPDLVIEVPVTRRSPMLSGRDDGAKSGADVTVAEFLHAPGPGVEDVGAVLEALVEPWLVFCGRPDGGGERDDEGGEDGHGEMTAHGVLLGRGVTGRIVGIDTTYARCLPTVGSDVGRDSTEPRCLVGNRYYARPVRSSVARQGGAASSILEAGGRT